MANGTSGGRRQRTDPSAGVTREAAVGAWGRTIAGQVLRGESILQNRHALPPPRTLPSAAASETGQAKRQAPLRFHGMNSIILRTLSVQRGHKDPTFALERTATTFNSMHGDTARPVKAGAKRIELPNSAPNADEVKRTYRDVKLSEDGPNHNEFGEQVQGAKGDKVRDPKGQIERELVDVEGGRRAPGVRVYYHRDDLNLPNLQARERPKENTRDYLITNTVSRNSRAHGLDVKESPDLAGRAELTMKEAGTKVGDKTLEKDTYQISIGPEATFPSVDQHRSALVQELSRFSMCRDGNADALAVAKADPAEREKMPEFARSELAASAATLETVTAVGVEYHPPTYSRENQREIRQTQAEHLRQDGALADVGRQTHRAERMNHNREPTAYDQAQRNFDRRQQAPRVEDAARGFATRGARPMPRAAAVPAGDGAPAQPPKAAPEKPEQPGAGRTAARTASAVQEAAGAATRGRGGRGAPSVDIGQTPKEPAAAPAQAAGTSSQTSRSRGKQKPEAGTPGEGSTSR